MHTIQHSYPGMFLVKEKRQSIFSRFVAWCDEQEKFRFGWVAAIITIHGCVLAPITVLTVMLGSNHMAYWGVAIGAMAMALVANLAAMPTKITIPVFFFSVLLDVMVIAINLAIFLS
jgi:hypothetical protein